MTKLTPEQRKRVAEECVPGCPWRAEPTPTYTVDGEHCVSINAWQPEHDLKGKDALTTRIAQLIVQHQTDAEDVEQRCMVHDQRLSFVEAIADNNIDDLESLCFELLEGE